MICIVITKNLYTENFSLYLFYYTEVSLFNSRLQLEKEGVGSKSSGRNKTRITWSASCHRCRIFIVNTIPKSDLYFLEVLFPPWKRHLILLWLFTPPVSYLDFIWHFCPSITSFLRICVRQVSMFDGVKCIITGCSCYK